MPNKFKTSILSPLIFILLLTINIHPQSFLITKYSTDNGLPDNRVNDIAQDSLGRMWVAMVSGIAMYDGYEWTKYGEKDGVPEIEYRRIKVDEKGVIWFMPASTSFEIVYYRQNKWIKVKQNELYNEVPFLINSIEIKYEDDKIIVLIGSVLKGVQIYEDGKWRSFNQSNGLISDSIKNIICIDQDIIIATVSGLSIIDKWKNLSNYSITNWGVRSDILNIYKSKSFKSSDSLVVLGENWIGKFINKKFKKTNSFVGLPSLGIMENSSIGIDHNNNIIFGNSASIFWIENNIASVRKIFFDDPEKDRGATSIFIDFERNIWLSSLRGIYKLTHNPFLNYSSKSGLLENEVSAVSEFSSGTIVFGHNYGLSLLKDERTKKISIQNDELNNGSIARILDIYHNTSNDLIYFVSVQRGIGIINQSGTIKWENNINAIRYFSLLQIPNHNIVAQTNKGFFSFNKKSELLPYLLPLIRDGILINNEYSFFASHRGLLRWNSSEKIHYKTKDIQANNLYSLFLDNKLGLLVGSAKGLYRLEQDTLLKYNFNNEDIKDPIYFIIQDSSKNIWLGTNNGVLKWDGKNLKRYNKNDGLAGNETNRAAGFVDSKGNVWIGTDEGVSMYTGNEPDYASFPPKVMLLDFKDHSNFRYSTNNNVNVDPDKNNLTFHYRGLSFLDEKRNSYQIKLSEVDGDYYNEFTTKATSARFNNLAPGDYVFSVRVKNSKGIWSNWANSSVITVKKFFYQELFFQLGVLGLFLFITYSLYNYIQQKKYTKQLEHAVDIRTKDLRETQDQLITSANRYKGIIESQSDLVVRLTEEGILTFVNDAYCSVFGKKQDELIGKSFVPLVHPDDLAPTFEEIKKLKDYPYRGTIEQRGRTIDGYRWYSWEGYAIRDPFGQILEIQAVGRDITLQKEIESELEKRVTERTIELQSLISQSPLGILTFDSEGKLITFNKIANQMFEFLDEYIGSEQNYNLFKDEFLVKNNYADKLFNLDAPHGFLLTPPILIDSVSNKIYSKLFNHFLVYRIYILKFDENNKTYVMLVDDVTEQQNTEEVSKRLLEEKIRISTIFKTIESERERFAKELHDGLGQLLTTAKLKLDIIKLKTDKSILEINDTVNLLINAGDEIRRIISDLKPSDVENFGLSSSIELLIERTRQAAGINIILAILTTTEFKNKNTEIIIYRIVQEALNNIVKHSDCKTAVIELSSSDSELQLNIIDDGVGLEITKLNEKIKSYGIHNIQERVTSLNGKVEIETKPGEGFKYHITIPI